MVCPSLKIFERLIDIRTPPFVKKASPVRRHVISGSNTSMSAQLSRFVGICLPCVSSLTALSNFGELTPRFGTLPIDLTSVFVGFLGCFGVAVRRGRGCASPDGPGTHISCPQEHPPRCPGPVGRRFSSVLVPNFDFLGFSAFCLSLFLFRCMSHLTFHAGTHLGWCVRSAYGRSLPCARGVCRIFRSFR